MKFFGHVGGAVFVGGEFVEIVVVGDIFVGRFFFGGAEGTLLQAIDFAVGMGDERRIDEIRKGGAGDGRGAGQGHAGQEAAAIQIGRLGSDFRRRNRNWFTN